jgi:hypothetical protein
MGGTPSHVISFGMAPPFRSSRSHCWTDGGVAGAPRRTATALAGVLPHADAKMTSMARNGDRAVRPIGMILMVGGWLEGGACT